MDEWLKIHTYIVCSTKSLAKLKMIDDWNNVPVFQLDESLWNINRSQNKIDSPFSVYKYVGLNQVLNYFDGIDNVDKFRIDESASTCGLNDMKKAIEILCNAGKKRNDRSKQWSDWCRENDCKE